MADEGEAENRALRAAILAAGDDDVRSALEDDKRSAEVLEKYQLPPAVREHLRALLDKVRVLVEAAAASRASGSPTKTDRMQPEDAVRPILLETFRQVKATFWISIAMSIGLFVVGLAFLGVALWQSLGSTAASTGTVTLAGVGVADFVILFYSRPWKDVTANLSNTQQIRMIATSYLASYSLIRDGKGEALDQLQKMTSGHVDLIQRYVEDDPEKQTETKPKPSADRTAEQPG